MLAQAVLGFKHFEQSAGTLIAIGGEAIGYNATSPGVYVAVDPATLACKERSFNDTLKIDIASLVTSLDTDGITRLCKNNWDRNSF